MKTLLIRTSLSLACLAALILAGCGGLSFNSQVAPEIVKGKYLTFGILPMENTTVTPPLYEFMQALVEDELVRKGYQKTTSDNASVKIAMFARLDDVIDKSAYGATYLEAFDEYKIDKQGMLQVIMFDAETRAWIWWGELCGVAKEDNPGQSEKSKQRLKDAIIRMLREIPVRQ